VKARDRRAVLTGALVLAPALLFTFAARPYLRALSDVRARVASQADLLRREEALVAEARTLPARLGQDDRTLASVRSRFVNARDPLAGVAALVGLVGEAARRQGVYLEAVESRPPATLDHGLVALQVIVRGRSDFEGVTRWLRALETAPQLLRVEQLELALIGGGALSPADSRDVETLAVAANVRAYLLIPERAGTPPASVAVGP
jgi:type II secretory pathway component PulM